MWWNIVEEEQGHVDESLRPQSAFPPQQCHTWARHLPEQDNDIKT